jgi:hypothetical protein
MMACNPSSGHEPAVPQENYQGTIGASDQAPLLQLERDHTNSRDIAVTWTDVPGVSDFSLEVAEDDACQVVRRTMTITGHEARLIDLDEGVWYLCLKTAAGIPLGAKSQALVVDRSAPVIEGDSEQTLVSGDLPALTVKDLSETECSWTHTDARLRIMDPNALLSPFTVEASGIFSVSVRCEDRAGNSSSLELTLSVAVGEATLGPAPSEVTGLQATPGVNVINLSWTASGASTYLVLESSSAITAKPMPGMIYTVGSLIGGARVKAASSATTLSDSGLAGNSLHYYKVFAASATGRYSPGVETSAMAIANKVLKQTLTRTGQLSYSDVVAVRTAGNYNYICRGAAGLAIVNISNPSAPVQSAVLTLGNTASSGWCSDVKIAGNYAYVANWDRGLVIVDISNPAAPVQRGSVALTNASVVFVEGSYAYVAVENNASGGGLAVINVSNPAAPTQSSMTSSNGHGAGVNKVGNHVYLTHRDTGTFKGLRVYDVTNPSAPNLVRSVTRASMEDIDIRDNHAYITVGSGGLEIFDVTTPSNPISRSTIATTGNGLVLGVSVADNHAFITDYTFNKLYVIDVSNKTAPTIARSYTASAGALYLHVSGGFVSMTVEGRGLDVIEAFQFL